MMRNRNRRDEEANQVTIRTVTIGNNLFNSNLTEWLDRASRPKEISGSFGSDNSVESFGSLDGEEPLAIMNPGMYTVHKNSPKNLGKEAIAEFKVQEDINWSIQ